MEWLRAHPYTSSVVAALVLFAAGAFVVKHNTPVSSQGLQVVTWQGTGTVVNPIVAGPDASSPQSDGATILQQVEATAPYTYLPPASASSLSNTSADTSFNFNTFMSLLSGTPSSGSSSAGTSGSTDVSSAYAFIPTGLIAASAPTPKRSAEQQALYTYGNEAGSAIQAFEMKYPDAASILKDQAEDRTDPAKAAALEKLGNDLAGIGKALLAISDVPPTATAAHQALAQSYIDIGDKLALVPQAQSDASFVAAIETYDASVNVFVTNYVALAQLFGSYGVTFSQDDPGSVFSFSPVAL